MRLGKRSSRPRFSFTGERAMSTTLQQLANAAAKEIHHFNIAMVDDRCTLPQDRIAAILLPHFQGLAKDSERLDWLEDNQAGLNTADHPRGPHVWIEANRPFSEKCNHYRSKSYRETIDIAMSQSNPNQGAS